MIELALAKLVVNANPKIVSNIDATFGNPRFRILPLRKPIRIHTKEMQQAT
jgi:hypothetical protein